MLNNKITDKFFNSIEGCHKVTDFELLDMLIGGCEIVGIEQSFAEEKGEKLPSVNMYFKNASKETLAMQINPLITNDNNPDISVFICVQDLDDETEINQENNWDNVPYLTEKR